MVSQHGTWRDELWTCWVYSSDMAEHQVEHDIEHMEQIMEQSMEHITEDIWKIYGRYMEDMDGMEGYMAKVAKGTWTHRAML